MRLLQQLLPMLENLPTAAVLVLDGRLVMNAAVERITGIPRAELPDLDAWFPAVYGPRAAEVRAGYQDRRARDFGGKRLVAMERRGGGVRHVEITAFFDGKDDLWLLNDLTDLLAAQEAFKLLFENSVDGNVIIDLNESNPRFLEANAAAVRMVGAANREDLIGRAPIDFLPPVNAEGRSNTELLIEAMNGAQNGVAVVNVEHYRCDRSIFPMRLTLCRVTILGRPCLLATWHDLTGEHLAQTQLVQNSKMVSLGEMSAGLAHELNTPLAVIKGRAQHLRLLAERGELGEDTLAKGLDVVEATVTRIASIVSGLRAFGRESANDPMVPVRVNTVIEDTLSFCRTRLGQHGVRLKVEVDQALEILCRPSQIAQVLLNLINNAYDAVEAQDDRWIQIAATVRDGLVEVRVRDGGPGVPAAVRAKIMQPFFTTKPVGKGTGLGLSVSSGIIHSHGGELTLDEADAHTCFVFRLPVVALASA